MSMTWRQLRNILKDFPEERLDNLASIDVFINNKRSIEPYDGDRVETLSIEFDDDKCLIVDTPF